MPAFTDGHLYVADGQGNVAVFDAATGVPGWTRKLPKPAGSPAYSDGMLVVGAGDGIYALDPVSGAPRWKLATRDPVESSPAIDHGTVYVGLPDGSLAAIDLKSGSLRWQTPIGGAIKRAPAVGDGLVFAGGDGGTFAAVSAGNGGVVWQKTLGPGQVSTPAVRDGVVYVASGLDERAAPHTLSAFRAGDGVAQWAFAAPSGDALYVGSVGPELVYIVGLDGNVYAVRGGVVRWRHDAGAPIGSVATLSEGILYVSVSDGTIEALDADSGEDRWSVRVRGDPGPVIVDHGSLYVGTALGQLAAFSEATSSDAP
jgi:outer membrane protein assembly factor BamB